ncbi:MAG: type IV pili methyl-accepting chemotaxis transducer N-terminal domain-containing protein [Pseudomonadota bacterium]
MRLTHYVTSIALAAAMPLMTPHPSAAAITAEQDGAAKINISGRQRMLTQRMAAAACFIAIGVQPDEQTGVLTQARDLYANSLAGLASGNADMGMLLETDEQVLAEIKRVGSLWKDFSLQVEISLNGDPSAALVLMELSVPILQQSDRVVKALVASRGASGGLSPEMARTIDLAGRQRMLSQRIAKSACAMQGAMFPELAAEELTVAKQEFDAALIALEAGTDGVVAPPTPEIAAQLEIVRTHWGVVQGPLDEILGGALLSADEMAAIADKTSELLREMNKAVGMYEASS